MKLKIFYLGGKVCALANLIVRFYNKKITFL